MKSLITLMMVLAININLCAQIPTQPQGNTVSQVEDPKLAELQKKFLDEQDRLKSRLTDTSREIEILKAQIDVLKRTPNPDLKNLIDKTNERINKIEDFNKEATLGEQKLDRLRYETGEQILVSLITDSGKLKVATGLSSTLTGFQTLTNPVANEKYAVEINNLKAKLRGTDYASILDGISKGSSPIVALTSNPYISLAFSVGAFVASRFRREDNKLDTVSNIACVIDYTSRAVPDLRFIELNLGILDTQVRSFQETTQKRFVDYALSVNYKGTWDDYKKELARTARSPIQLLAEPFFETLEKNQDVQANLSKGKVPIELATIRFQIENVKGYLAEYEEILKRVDDFYASYIVILGKSLNETSTMTLCSGQVLNQTKEELSKIVKGAEKARSEFREEFKVSVSAPSKRVLYGIR